MNGGYYVVCYKDGKINTFGQECDYINQYADGRMISFETRISNTYHKVLSIINVDEIRSIDRYEK